jgi:hypothetical protein
MIAATPLEEIIMEIRNIGVSELFRSITIFPRDFLLVWDWEESRAKLDDRKEYRTSMTSTVKNRSI